MPPGRIIAAAKFTGGINPSPTDFPYVFIPL